MAPAVGALAQSESKVRFMDRLKLNSADEYHARVYRMMKEEAIEARRRMTDNQDALLPHLKESAQVRAPYSYSQICEAVLHREILRIYSEARPETKAYYDLGRDTEGITEENWVIRWLIWHVFRYRDNRNRSRRAGSPSETPPEGDSDGKANMVGESQLEKGTLGNSRENVASGQSRYWDPVRDG